MANIKMTLSVRRKLEEMLKKKVAIADIAEAIGASRNHVYNELSHFLSAEDYAAKRYENYSAAKAQKRAEKEMVDRIITRMRG